MASIGTINGHKDQCDALFPSSQRPSLNLPEAHYIYLGTKMCCPLMLGPGPPPSLAPHLFRISKRRGRGVRDKKMIPFSLAIRLGHSCRSATCEHVQALCCPWKLCPTAMTRFVRCLTHNLHTPPLINWFPIELWHMDIRILTRNPIQMARRSDSL
jgi:hypothetical protein